MPSNVALVSILIPAFNAEKWIAETLRSALAQTWPRIEIVVVDDGSSDRTLAVARQFAATNVLIVGQDNAGASAARNRAYALCQGEYVQWLDADDLLAPDKIARQMHEANQCGQRTLLSSPWASFAYRPHRAKFVSTALWNDLAPVDWLLLKMDRNLFMQTATWLTSRELCEAAGPWDTRLGSDDDGEYFCRVLIASSGVKFIAGGGVFYRNVPADRLSYIGTSDKKMDSMLLSMQLHVSYLRRLEDSERVRRACLAYLRNWSGTFFPHRPDILAELDRMAKELGGQLEFPSLGWKYRWLEPLFGRSVAKRAQLALPQMKARMRCAGDRLLSRLERRWGASPAAEGSRALR